MKTRPTVSAKVLTLLISIVGVIMVATPFHAFLSVWASSLFGHYLLIRLWKEALLVVTMLIAAYILVRNAELRRQLLSSRLTQLIAVYALVTLLLGAVSRLQGHVTLKALGYGLLVDLRFLAWFLVVWVLAKHRVWLQKRWHGLIFWPAAAVCVIGLLQYFALPYDFLRHFGYNATTIYPYETVNHNLQYLRVFSTLRGANPLGAYLLVVITLLAVAKQHHVPSSRRIALGVIVSVTLVLTYSRAALLGTVISLLVLTWLTVRGEHSRKFWYYGVGSLTVMALLVFIGLHHNAALQNAVLHTDDNSTVATSSNQGHSSALRSGVRDVLHQPLGRGPGTAGPASVYNDGKARIAENYYLQIGQETGWLGLVLFAAISAGVLYRLWQIRDSSLGRGLLAAGIGLVVVNMLSHAWTDDTLAYIWWGLAGIALAARYDGKAEL